jgi:hypothetical protein
MTLADRIRNLSPTQQRALASIDRAEQRALALEDLEVDHLASEEVYRRRRDRLRGVEVPDRYLDLDAARVALAQAVRRRQARYQEIRLHIIQDGAVPEQLELPQP